MTITPHTTSTALIRGAKPTFAPTNETEAAAKRNADNVRILAELPIPVWQRISEFTGMEDIYAMRASTSVFSRPISANHLEDLWQYTFRGRLIVPGCEIPFPTRSLDFPKGAAQTADMPALIGMAEQLSAELVDIQLKASELFSNIPAKDLLQQDDIPWLFNYLFSEETQVEQTTLIARIMRLGNFVKTLLEAVEKKN